jgi:oxygen-independent coproporphyrinogen-3 oxidase
MAGIYIHIPFCKQACHYCDFHFSTSDQTRAAVLSSLHIELQQRVEELAGQKIQTIYFGGGTPSLLTISELMLLFETIYRFYDVSPNAEITLEANPDDLHKSKRKEYRNTPINRLSIGVQSFHDDDLKYMNRCHNSNEAESAIKGMQDEGFENITIDLIYGTPTMNNEQWQHNLTQAINCKVPHISSYALTVEENTPLFHLIKRKKTSPVDEERLASQFFILTERLAEAGFEQYEISNFAKKNFESKHNTSYWKGIPYLGIGPSAHSYDGYLVRRWNVSNNVKYMKGIAGEGNWFEREHLTDENRCNEYIMTQLRLREGLSLSEIEKRWGSATKKSIEQTITHHPQEWFIPNNEDSIVLSVKGKLLADRISSLLMI